MSVAGVDYSFSRPSAAALTAAKIGFVCRYLSSDGTPTHSNPKDLSAPEVAMLHGAGISIVLNYETSGTFMQGGYAAGLAIARWAREQATSLGAPAGVPIYYSADFNATSEQISGVLDFMHGAADAEGSKDRVGVYGSFAVVEAAAGAGFKYLWQTYAWSAGQWSAHAVLRQTSNDQKLGGVAVDLDEAVAQDYGQWAPTDAPTPPPGGSSGRPSLSAGSTGSWVAVLQRSLMLAGQNPRGVDGHFGLDTLAAVRAAQEHLRLTVDGEVGPATWGALEGRTRAVQVALTAAGHRLLEDGEAGPLTAAAVLAFQRERRLFLDGIVGPHTSAALKIPAVS
jgi:peptidoglycan hydrolase-like protein with peptidoglycan-binding domain